MAARSVRAKRHARPASRSTPLMERVRAGNLSLVVQHENLDEKIYATLRKLILERQFQPGERILVDHLAAEMGVSRTPILNALRRLSQEGVVEIFARRGIYVRRYEKAEMARLFAVREVLDGLATRLAAAHIQKSEIDDFTQAFRRHGWPRPAFGATRSTNSSAHSDGTRSRPRRRRQSDATSSWIAPSTAV